MSAALEWPAGARITAQGRAELEAEHRQQERAAAAARAARTPEPPALIRRLAAAEQKIAQLERALADRPNTMTIADAVGQALANLHHELLGKALAPEAVQEAVGAAMSSLHAGTWKTETGYPMGCMTTSDGSLWLAKVNNRGVRPGSGDGCWQLIVKGYRPASRKKELAR